jgi:methyltransferase-like protein/2-polyprenyl-3-methyl-5-hydroxy-6-metoxy-1,4-benzoquinol methylase
VTVTYDEVPYPALSHASTHPDSLATLALLVGMQPAPVEGCRVLELGCGVGGNLIPMACALPCSKFLGIDLSGRQIATGREHIAALGLQNISLEQMNILDMTPELGKFDYLIAHGVFSWVPPVVQEKILEVCRQNLAPQGVAFVSYNTFPGWHMISIARGIMRYYTRAIADPVARAQEARKVLEWFAQSGDSESNGYYGYLKLYVDYLSGKQDGDSPKEDSALLHDELEEMNLPLYFHEFVERATTHGLQYLGDVEQTPTGEHLAEKLEYLRHDHPSLIDMEQSYDFLQNRTFRRTLLCHQEVQLTRKVTPGRMADFYVVSAAQPLSEKPDIAGAEVEKFRSRNGATFSTDHPLSKAAFACLAEAWPRPLKFESLAQAALARLEAELQAQDPAPGQAQDGKAKDPRVLAANLLHAFDYSSSLVELHSFGLRLATHPGARPTASPWAARQAQDQAWVTNLRHERVELDGFDRYLLTALNGRRDQNELVELFMLGPIAAGELTLENEGKPINEAELRALVAQEIGSRLNWLARVALVIDPSQEGEGYGKPDSG